MEYYTAIGIDVSDKTSKICVMAKIAGERRIVEETTVATTKEAFSEYLATKDRKAAVTFETGAHCRWMAQLIRSMGFKVNVADAFELQERSERRSGAGAVHARRRRDAPPRLPPPGDASADDPPP